MKRILALALAMLIACALPALADFGFREEGLSDGSVICHFEDFDLTLPAGWEDKALMVDGDDGLSFYHAASYMKYLEEDIEGGGFLFRLGASVNGSFSELPAFKYLGFSESSAMNYYMQLPSDYPAWMGDEAIRAEYDAMYAQIDAIAASAVFPGNVIVEDGNGLGDDVVTVDGNGLAEEPEDGTGQYEAGGTGTMTTDAEAVEEGAAAPTGATLERLRYHFEHSALPRYFFDDPANMLDVLNRVGAYTLFASLGDENGVEYDYTAEDFPQRLYTAADGTQLMQLDLPRPEVSPQCYRIYMLYNPDTGFAAFYTIEYENLLGETALLCSWDAEGNHADYGAVDVPEKGVEGYDAALLAEAMEIADFAGVSTELTESAPEGQEPDAQVPDTENLAVIECPEQGFTTLADPAYEWDYQEGTGITIYTEAGGRIPYVIVFQSEDWLAEPLAYIKEQYTPRIQEKYGDDLVGYVEYEFYDIGGKSLPAGLYTYKVQGHVVDMLRIYDSTGEHTVTYTAKYEQGMGDATLAALDTAIRGFQAE